MYTYLCTHKDAQTNKSDRSDNKDMSEYQVLTSDGKIFKIDVKELDLMTTLKAAVDNGDVKPGQNDFIPVSTVDSNDFKLIMEFATQIVIKNQMSEIVDGDTGQEDVVCQKLKTFEDIQDLIKLATAVNFLGFKEMVKIVCKEIAERIKAANTNKEILDILGLEEDFTDKEREEVAKGVKWYEEEDEMLKKPDLLFDPFSSNQEGVLQTVSE